MNVDPSIFRLYDIRGLYPNQLNKDVAYVIARGFLRFLKKETGKKKLVICVGRDVRPSSDELFEGFGHGVLAEGGLIVDSGFSMTPALYFAVSHYGYDGGVNITASHNPNPFNGFKLVREKAVSIGGPNGLEEIQEIVLGIADGACPAVPLPAERVEKKDLISDYVALNTEFSHVAPQDIAGMRVAIDAGNGAAGMYVARLMEKFPGVFVHPLYFEPDGSFPHHIPDPLLLENLQDLIAVLKAGAFNVGVAFDGDGDRIIFVDERGAPIRGDILTALMARLVLREHPKVKIGYDIRSSRVVERVIRGSGGVPVMTRVGHALIKPKMRAEDIYFTGELSGHYYLGENLFYEVPFFVLLKVMYELARTKMKMSELLATLPAGYQHSGEINFEVEDKAGKIKEIEDRFRDGKVLLLDGLRVDYDDWWFNVRPSNTEPYLRLVVEADSAEKLKEKVEILKKLIEK